MRLALKSLRWQCWRHGRGFGVHSPFAYRFITETLRERCPYYAYDRLEAFGRREGPQWLTPRLIRLIFRIINRFQPESVAVAGSEGLSVIRAIACAVRRDTGFRTAAAGAPLVIVTDIGSEVITPSADCVTPAVWVFPCLALDGARACYDALTVSLTCGQSFADPHGRAVVVIDPKLPRQHFDVKF